ncbi:hypothetical protein [Alkalidesulfovibrio alkalitolerans]|uniref:hypothetical protein n=1 Tax=Alkalidesulfovibrio alkalitolerans TaxID=293256 RepID=UPI00058B3CE9|nr:hypothetical protein [Alkalidesulfovibrio alkalitolerans]
MNFSQQRSRWDIWGGLSAPALAGALNLGIRASVGQKRYARALRIDEKRRVMARWDRLLARAIDERPEPGKVILIRTAGGG